MTEWRMLAISTAIFLLTVAVLAIRYGHARFPYREDADEKAGKAYIRE
jgi:protein PsiE